MTDIRKSRWRAASVTASAVALVVVAGCSSDKPKEPSETPTGSTPASTSASPSKSATPSASATPTVDLAKLPPEARENTTEGAKAFAEYFMEEVDRTAVTTDTTHLKTLYTPECRGCQNAAENIDRMKGAKIRQRAESANVTKVQASAKDGRSQAGVYIDYAKTEQIDSAGKVIRGRPPESALVILQLAFQKTWKVTNLEVVSK